MSSIVLELQAEAMSHSGSVLSLLRMTTVVSTKLGIKEVREWVRLEMQGYPNYSVPDYRQFTGHLKALNPFHGWQPVAFQDEKGLEYKKKLTSISIGNAVSEVEAWLSSEGSFIQLPVPQELACVLGIDVALSRFVAKAALNVIPDRIRGFILDWSLELEQKGILGEGMTFTAKEKAQAPSVVMNNYFTKYLNTGQAGAMGDSAVAKSLTQRLSEFFKGE